MVTQAVEQLIGYQKITPQAFYTIQLLIAILGFNNPTFIIVTDRA